MSHPSAAEIKLGRLALEMGILTPKQINDCVFEQESRPGIRIGEIFVEKGYMTSEDVDDLLREQKRRRDAEPNDDAPDNPPDPAQSQQVQRMSEEEFARILVDDGHVKQMGVQECQKIQSRLLEEKGQQKSLARILVELAYLTRDEVKAIVDAHSKPE
jgi:hypothetical protein